MKPTPVLPSQDLTLQFPHAHACVLFTLTSQAGVNAQTGEGKPTLCAKLHVQAIDAYGFQRELSVAKVHHYDPNTSKTTFHWEMHVYAHPGRRERCEVTEAEAKAFIVRLLDIAQKYPTLLFNASEIISNGRFAACSEGFVHLCERLHRGATLAQAIA